MFSLQATGSVTFSIYLFCYILASLKVSPEQATWRDTTLPAVVQCYRWSSHNRCTPFSFYLFTLLWCVSMRHRAVNAGLLNWGRPCFSVGFLFIYFRCVVVACSTVSFLVKCTAVTETLCLVSWCTGSQRSGWPLAIVFQPSRQISLTHIGQCVVSARCEYVE